MTAEVETNDLRERVILNPWFGRGNTFMLP